MTQLIPVDFQGDRIFLVEHEGEPFTPVRPICENIGIAWQPQAAKLAADRQRWGCHDIVTPSAGGPQAMTCLPIRKLPAWLVSISPRKVRADIRPKLERYQAECDDVLWRYWTEGFAVRRDRRPPNPEAAAEALVAAWGTHRVPPPDTVAIGKDEYIDLLKAKLALAETRPARPKRRAAVPVTAEELAEMRRLRAAGWSLSAIARRLGRSGATVSLLLRPDGIRA